MNRIATQSLFSSQVVAGRSWGSYLTSGLAHVVIIALLLLLTFPAVRDIATPRQHVTLIAPVLPAYTPKTILRPVIHNPIKRPVVTNVTPPKPVILPPVVKPPEPKRQLLAKAPEVVVPVAAPTHNVPAVKIEAPAPPKPEVRTGLFAGQEQARGARQQQNVKTGGFGDPNGVPAQNANTGKLQLAKVGGFDLPSGADKGGGGGQSQNGGVRSTGFGDSTQAGGGGAGTHGTVRTGGFGDSTAGMPGQVAQVRPVQPVTTQVEILFKPKPLYTSEAKELKIEGQVSLNVIFLADGGIKVVRVLHGLGHGLDEAAEQAAMQVRFRPATRGGQPVDTNATIYITFQLG